MTTLGGKPYIKSPINYTGNKFRLLGQFERFFPEKCKVFVDLFCGGATVGINVQAEEVIMVDNNPRVISLLKHLMDQDLPDLIYHIEKLISKYDLTYSAKYDYDFYKRDVKDNNGLKEFNRDGYYKLRADYNSLKDKGTAKANDMLYVLMAYGFNNDLRFNRQGEFNLPVGKTDFNKNNLKKITEYNKVAKQKNISFVCADYDSDCIKEYLGSADFAYVDPPYLITTAVYNEGNNWLDSDEETLVKLLSSLDQNGTKFALSNVLTKVGVENRILGQWLSQNPHIRINNMDYNYRSCSYNKKNRDAKEQEVLITN